MQAIGVLVRRVGPKRLGDRTNGDSPDPVVQCIANKNMPLEDSDSMRSIELSMNGLASVAATASFAVAGHCRYFAGSQVYFSNCLILGIHDETEITADCDSFGAVESGLLGLVTIAGIPFSSGSCDRLPFRVIEIDPPN